MKMASKIVMSLTVAAFAVGASAADVLTGKGDMTLYTFDADSAGKSACSGGCAAVWPPAAPENFGNADYGEITRADGTKQLTYKGKPLYYFANDKKPGDKNGDGVQGAWHVATKAGAAAPAKSSGSAGYSPGY